VRCIARFVFATGGTAPGGPSRLTSGPFRGRGWVELGTTFKGRFERLLEEDQALPTARSLSPCDLTDLAGDDQELQAAQAPVNRSGPEPRIMLPLDTQGSWAKAGGSGAAGSRFLADRFASLTGGSRLLVSSSLPYS
jgi:hypothetical protein